eukprot:CAMPEP_0197247472 /NCGR_PEP_ID=MMETSP1429-20130617/29212_1 /TAXON_ID=49237 /ORGANISM="Chaetoceros  sp., Strain UNC1202" /LENGTH=449 /DNA_ID=CAMNT_0042708387 /DNA_START=61 /DNA_END=1410 /DNA_ORIENTATION=+
MIVVRRILIAAVITIFLPVICTSEEIGIGDDSDMATATTSSASERIRDDPSSQTQLDCPACAECHCDCVCPVSMVEFENLQHNLDTCISEKQVGEDLCKTQLSRINLELEQSKQEAVSKSEEIKKLNLEHLETVQVMEQNFKLSQEANEKLRQDNVATQSDYNTALQKLKSLEEANEKQRQDNIATQSDYSTALQKLRSLKEANELIKSNQKAKVKVLQDEIKSSAKDAQKYKSLHKDMQDKFYDTRTKVTDMENELRIMERKSRSTYLNTTLIMEDATNFAAKNIDGALYAFDKFMRKPEVQDFKESVHTKISPVMQATYQFYEGNVAPSVEAVFRQITEIDAVEGIRLCIISMTRQAAGVALNYIDLAFDQGRKSHFRRITERKLKYTKENTEAVVHTTLGAILALCALKLAIFLFLLPFRFVFGGKKTGGTKKKAKKKVKTKKKVD